MYDDPYMDFAWKFVSCFRQELAQVASTGVCPLSLFLFILILRSQMPSDTQDVEGMNSILQWMTKIAPTIKKALVNTTVHQQRDASDTTIPNGSTQLNDFVYPPKQNMKGSNYHVGHPMHMFIVFM